MSPALACAWATWTAASHGVPTETRDRLRHSGFGEHGVGARHEATRRPLGCGCGIRPPVVWRRRTGIEPAQPRCSAAPVLKTGRATRRLYASVREASVGSVTNQSASVRLTQYAAGGGCACKIPPGELEEVVRGLGGQSGSVGHDLLVGLDDGDDGAVVRVGPTVRGDQHRRLLHAGRRRRVRLRPDRGGQRALRRLRDGGSAGARDQPGRLAPRRCCPSSSSGRCSAADSTWPSQAGCPVAGGHSIDDPEPKYGMAVTGVADPDRLLRNDSAQAGLPISLTKPIGVGVLNNRHKATGEAFPQAIASMVELNDLAMLLPSPPGPPQPRT